MNIIFCLDKFIHLKFDNLGTKQHLMKYNFLCIGLLDLLFPPLPQIPILGVNLQQGKLTTLYKDCWHHLFYTEANS